MEPPPSNFNRDRDVAARKLTERYDRLARQLHTSLKKIGERLRVCSMPSLYLSGNPPHVEAALLDVCDGVGLVIVDNLRAACPHAKSENDSAMRLYLDLLTRVSLATGCVVLVIVHEGKQQDGSGRPGLQRVRGSGAIVDAAGAVLSATHRLDVLRIEQTKASSGPAGRPVHVQLVDGTTKTGRRTLKIEKVEAKGGERRGDERRQYRDRIVEKLRNSPGIKVTQLIGAVGGRRSEVEAELKKLREEKLVVDEPGPRGAKLLKLASVGGDDA